MNDIIKANTHIKAFVGLKLRICQMKKTTQVIGAAKVLIQNIRLFTLSNLAAI